MTQETPLTGDYSHLDSKAPLSMKDLGILLLDHCNTKAINERDLTDAKLETTIKGFCDQFVKLRSEMRQHVLDHTGQVAEMKMKITELENSSPADNVFSDLDLKITTISNYLEQLIFSMKSGLQDTLLQID